MTTTTDIPCSGGRSRQSGWVISDKRLLARVRRLIRKEHAGFITAGNKCIEPGCSCWDACPPDRDPISGPFRKIPVRCTSFETNVLPQDPALEKAYWDHVEAGTPLHSRRCQEPGCRREVRSPAPNALYCEFHAKARKRTADREARRRYRHTKREKSAGRNALQARVFEANRGSLDTSPTPVGVPKE